MTSFANLSANLKLNIQDFTSKLREASNQVNRFGKNLNGEVVSGMKELNKQTNAWGLNLKSISRVVSGIVISQAFYRILQSVQSATNAVWEFTKQLEYAHIAYSNLFGDTALATEFINVLKDFAAKSPFSFVEAEAAAKRLLAYGIEYKNVMYVMQGVMSAASIQGDATKIESISRAFGQIYTYGKLMTQEVRQLSEAGIPAYEILQEELGLTQEQLRNLGNEGIPASEAINALVDGIQKRFGNAMNAAALTITGIISNIKDNAVMLFSGIFEPATIFIKSALAALGQLLFTLRELYELKGVGGVFEQLFPEEAHATLRQFVANLQSLGLAIVRLFASLSGLLKPAISALIMLFNAFAPVISLIANVLAELVSIITHNATAMRMLTAALAAAAAMWVMFKVKALAAAVVTAVISGISKAIAILASVLTFVVAHPFWALLIGLTGLVVGLSVGFGNLSNKVNSFFKQLTQFNGVDPDKVLLPSQKERANDLDRFNNRLEGTSDAMDDLADSTGKATKAAKGLLSFDEVFKLNEPDEGTGEGLTDPGLEDLLEGLNGLGSGYMPEVPDFSEYMSLLSTNFLDKLRETWNKIKEAIPEIVGMAIGAGFGRLAGWLLGGKLGGIFGTILGTIVGYFWEKLAEYFNLTPDQKINAGIIGGIGSIIGTILGGILGGPLGAKIGFIIGGLVSSFWGIFAEALGVVPEQHIATLLSGGLTGAVQMGLSMFKSLAAGLVPTFTNGVFSGFSRMVGFSFKEALTGALKQGAIGAIVGLGTGILSNALTAWIAQELNLTEQDLANSGTGQVIGNIIGTIAGLILGGPWGSLVGGALGQVAGALVGEFWSYMNNALKGSIIGGAAGLPIGALVGVLVGSIGGPLGAAIGAAIGVVLGGLIGLIVDNWDSIVEFFSGIGEVIAGAVSWVIDGFKSFGEAISGFFNGEFDLASIGAAVGEVFSNLKDTFVDFGNSVLDSLGGVGTFIRDVFSGLGTFFGDIGLAVTTVWNDIKLAVTTVTTDLWTAITTIWNDIKLAVTTVMTDLWTAITTVWNDVSSAVTTVCSAIWEVIANIWYLIRDLIIMVLSNIWNAVVEFFTPIVEEIAEACAVIWEGISTTFTGILNFVSQTLQNIWNAVVEFFTPIVEEIAEACAAIWEGISTTFTNIFNRVSQILQNIWDVVRNIFTNIWNSIKSITANVWNTVSQVFVKIYTTVRNSISDTYNSVTSIFTDIYTSIKNTISDMYESVKSGIGNIYDTFTGWISDLWTNVFDKLFGWINEGISKLREFFGLSSEASSITIPSSTESSVSSYGHATGGIFNREHVARFAEGNKTEAIIPLEEASAMQPFVTAVADGLTASLAPLLANFNGNNQQQLQPLYVGTLIADERSLRELERKMEIIRVQEGKR